MLKKAQELTRRYVEVVLVHPVEGVDRQDSGLSVTSREGRSTEQGIEKNRGPFVDGVRVKLNLAFMPVNGLTQTLPIKAAHTLIRITDRRVSRYQAVEPDEVARPEIPHGRCSTARYLNSATL
jgi:hypothetical protein